ncbi:MAG TPA: low-specificity L-threonine aldolase [Oscillospiraceae bacterium]|nr:low-specificity L-threonine aldolase [Oscillospiraceae bacterium]
MKIIDMRSDTVTKPTQAMRQAMAEAIVGDDVYGEDPTINRLEEMAAAVMSKEAALFVPSGSMGNQLAIMTHCERGVEAICDSLAHVFHYEMAAAATLSGVQLHPLDDLHNEAGIANLSEHIRNPQDFFPRTRLVCLENTLNRGGGTVMKPEQMAEVYRLAKEYGLNVHLDGARIFNAALALGCEPADITAHADSVMFCLSKGLGAPVGSILAGSRQFIDQARRNRKMLGGGMRQAGILAAAGIFALEDTSFLMADHEKAQYLAQALAVVPGLKVDLTKVQTNMVMVELEQMLVHDFLQKMQQQGVLAGTSGSAAVRFVTHRDVSLTEVQAAVEIIKALC